MGTLTTNSHAAALSDTEIARLLNDLEERGWSLATAESLTGGALAARLVDIPGASRVVRGGACTYAVETKTSVLGVDATQLAKTGPVDREVALHMARGARALYEADVALATTGVAGPGPADGFPAGTVHIACVTPSGEYHRLLRIEGDRGAVRGTTITEALHLLRDTLDSLPALPED